MGGYALLFIAPKLGSLILVFVALGAIEMHVVAMGESFESLSLQLSLLAAALTIFLFASGSKKSSLKSLAKKTQ